ncbi:Bug family tripartite tricarboxylate transporter substrate binding protein [Pseudorhodoferax sp.]|uniref:Bug family tripartite tricarboxylate transporter substrate binding protein n=1 Tax=Pseudorhodoferax sp. TaxID=1993553 RepID=UPI0039E2205F
MWKRRDLLAAGAAAVLLPCAARAQTFPSKPIKIVVPNAAGGGADLTARTVGQKLAEVLGQPVIIDNKPSAGGIVAGEQVARAPADGHTLLLVSAGTAVSEALFKSLPFDTLKDFKPVSMMASFDLAIAVAQNSRFRTLGDLLAHAKAHPGQLNIGTPQIGTTQNLATELFKTTAGIDAQIVPFNGTPPVITALRGGQLDAMIDLLGPLMPQITGGALRPLAVLGAKRAVQLPDVPTARETGGSLAQFDVSSWNGLSVPAGTPADVVARLNKAVNTVVAQADVKDKLLKLNQVAQGSTSEEVQARLEREIRRWNEVIARANIPKQ